MSERWVLTRESSRDARAPADCSAPPCSWRRWSAAAAPATRRPIPTATCAPPARPRAPEPALRYGPPACRCRRGERRRRRHVADTARRDGGRPLHRGAVRHRLRRRPARLGRRQGGLDPGDGRRRRHLGRTARRGGRYRSARRGHDRPAPRLGGGLRRRAHRRPDPRHRRRRPDLATALRRQRRAERGELQRRRPRLGGGQHGDPRDRRRRGPLAPAARGAGQLPPERRGFQRRPHGWAVGGAGVARSSPAS